MSNNIKFITKSISFNAKLNDCPCAKEIFNNLPIISTVSTWGDEIYFRTNLDISVGLPTTDVNIGDIAFWPSGKCICIFFGKTPISTGSKPVPASNVFVIGKTDCLPEELRKISDSEDISVEKA
ncbi:MAG: hypothetical protein KAI43_08070 [Candidatus Aureabacteria bacterium]|nr:hypothetical protein [Candidatus Auribacterota bacterium]